MSHWQLRLQRKLSLYRPNSFIEALFISFVLHVFIFIVPFLFIKHSGIIIIDSSGKYSLPVYYKYSGGTGFSSGSGSGSGKASFSAGKNISSQKRSGSKSKNLNKSSSYSNEKVKTVAEKISKETGPGSFLKFKKFSRKQALLNKSNKKNKSNKLEKNLNKTSVNKLDKKNLKNNKKSLVQEKKSNIKESIKETKQEEVIAEEKIIEKTDTHEIVENNNTQESNLPENLGTLDFSGDNLSGQQGDGSGIGTGFAIEGYLHSDGELVDGIRNAVGKNWSRPKGFSVDVFCEFKILVSQDGKSVKILEQKDSKVPAFNIQARGAILRTEFPEKCWNKELNLILR